MEKSGSPCKRLVNFYARDTTRLNFQLKSYVSYKPNPEAVAIDAFNLTWGKHMIPFSLSTFSSYFQDTEQDTEGQSNELPHCSILDSSNVLSYPYENVDRQACASLSETDPLTAAGKPEHSSPSSQETEDGSVYNKIFGGFVMMKAFELVSTTASIFFRGCPGVSRSIDDMLFFKSVEISYVLHLAPTIKPGGKGIMRLNALGVCLFYSTSICTRFFRFVLFFSGS
ncbi:acyl-CoA thioesterase 9, mitochondrial [Plakobranchus ocellatus]|uniref:Acyl-CoA thioesterase 9, mitochondrial n=1 Tax=Plakobranchus ocellatus TaxID=259542 RepID=A0AAV4CX14_9GAST|nr:acyl-CoA thioesterase 9, mitochondrial [Plakobranchus ocellatus]